MRKIVFSAALLVASSALGLAAHAARACGDDVSPIVNRPSNPASELFAEASRLEARASSMEVRAAAADCQADESSVEARALRIEASTIEGVERERVLAIAESMASQAASGHLQARQLREQATQLRVLARSERERALRLGGVRRGWRGAAASTI